MFQENTETSILSCNLQQWNSYCILFVCASVAGSHFQGAITKGWQHCWPTIMANNLLQCSSSWCEGQIVARKWKEQSTMEKTRRPRGRGRIWHQLYTQILSSLSKISFSFSGVWYQNRWVDPPIS